MLLAKEYVLHEIDRFDEALKKYDAEFRDKDKLPKNHDWRPYRWCSRDVVFALVLVQQERYHNCLKVDICLMANPPQYAYYSGPRVAMGFLLSEAYKCGTSMEIVFTENVESRVEDGVKKGRVPTYICSLAEELGIKLNHIMEGHITPFEARQMYMELAGFSKETQEKIMKLSVAGELSPERACFLVMGGVWTVPEAEALILGSNHPESVLLSKSEPEDRLLYLTDVLESRGAVLGGALDRKMLRKELIKDGQIIESEDEETELEISFDGYRYAKLYWPKEDLLIPWTGTDEQIAKAEDLLAVMIRARNSVEIQLMLADDLNCGQQLRQMYRLVNSMAKLYCLYPRDFEDLPEKLQTEIKQKWAELEISLMVSPESVEGLEKEAVRRIETGRMVRHE